MAGTGAVVRLRCMYGSSIHSDSNPPFLHFFPPFVGYLGISFVGRLRCFMPTELPVLGNGGRPREGECLYDRILRGTGGGNGPEGELGGQMASGGQLPAGVLRHHRHGTVR